VIYLDHARVIYNATGCLTIFNDGTRWGSYPHDTHHYHVVAHRTGYGDDILGYCREHEVAHLVIEQMLHDRPSRVLWALAHGEEISPADSAYEEFAAMTLQRFIRARERPIVGGVPWDEIRDFALSKLENAHVQAA
jgi:hypothetical protein